LFFDLDTVITGQLDQIASYDGIFATLRDFYRPNGLQSSVMAWQAGGYSTAYWETFERAGCPMDDPGGDQAWLERVYIVPDLLQEKYPDLFVSYKQIKGPPPKASVVVFHGKPRPHEVLTGWVPEVWKVGGLSRVELNAVCNTARDEIMGNVRSAVERDLNWFDFDGLVHDGHVAIVGGGPSLLDKIDEIRWRQQNGQSIWALNGTAAVLRDHGIWVDAHVILDARPENASFINHKAAEYLIASQCAPAVFERLDRANVTLWHPHIDGMEEELSSVKDKPVHLIGGGTTVGLLAMSLAFLRGYRQIHLYGFDSCYQGDEHHAYAQNMNDGERIIDVLFDGQKYRCAPWMAGQADEFQGLAEYMIGQGAVITAHGSGLIPAMAYELLVNPPMRPAQIRAREVLSRLNGAKHPRGAEVGVFAGEMSAALLASNPILHLDMVDSWEGFGAAYEGDSGDWHAGLSQSAQDGFYDAALQRTAFAADRRTVLRQRSTEAARNRQEYDFVFLDADHSYEGVSSDIVAWAPKIKPGGWLGGHDYENTDFPKFGVTQAVNEYVASTGLKLELGDNYTWFVHIPHNPSEGN
jgi:hypothetical protein